MLGRRFVIGFVLAVVVCGTSCRQELFVDCSRYSGTYPIQYMGGALGRGELTVEPLADRNDVMLSKITLWDETGTDAVIHLEGPGSCDQGVLRVRFGGGDHPASRIKVLGGNLVGVPDPELFDWMFGAWEVEVLMKETNELSVLQGFVREDGATTPDPASASNKQEPESDANRPG